MVARPRLSVQLVNQGFRICRVLAVFYRAHPGYSCAGAVQSHAWRKETFRLRACLRFPGNAPVDGALCLSSGVLLLGLHVDDLLVVLRYHRVIHTSQAIRWRQAVW